MTVTFKDERYNEKQAAKHLGVAQVTLNKWRQRGKGPIVLKMGGQIRYLKSDLDAWLLACRAAPSELQHPKRRKRKPKLLAAKN
jgi:predicted DNA-binding transcriptional regulator AlpA